MKYSTLKNGYEFYVLKGKTLKDIENDGARYSKENRSKHGDRNKMDNDSRRFFRRLLRRYGKKELTFAEDVAKVRQAEKKGRK